MEQAQSAAGPSGGAGAPLLAVKGLFWTAPEGKKILDGVDFELASGEAAWIRGPSGGGKSTFLRLVNGLLPGGRGEITLAGRPQADWPPTALRRQAALLTQLPVMLAGSVRHNLLLPFGLKAAAGRPRPGDAAMAQTLAALGLEDVNLESPAGPLSVGQKQRLALARLLLMKPSLLLLDEPVASLDPQSAAQVERAALDHAKVGGGVIFVSHQPPAGTVRRLLLSHGRLVEEA